MLRNTSSTQSQREKYPSTTPPSLPADVGCIVDNVATVMAIGDAISESKPLMDRVITVSGGAAEEPRKLSGSANRYEDF